MKVRIKKLNENAVIPAYAHVNDAGLDLTATSKNVEGNRVITYGTGLAVEIPEGYVGLIFPRSSNSKKNLLLTNSVGVIDSGYRGEIMLKFMPTLSYTRPKRFLRRLEFIFCTHVKSKKDAIITSTFCDDKYEYQVGDRIGQLIIIPYPHIEFEEVDDLTTTDRGEGGYGSTGK